MTGASSGIGAGIAERLCADGWTVAIHGHAGASRATALRDRLRARGATVETYLADVSDESAVDGLFASILRDLGDLDAVVSNAGIFPRSRVIDMSVAEWDRVQAVNARGMFLVCRAAARHFTRRGRGGRIVTTASGSASRGMPRGAHYAASKAAVVAFTKSLALELAADGILVNAVAPGTVDTPMPRGGNTEAELLERARTAVPLRRMGRPEDIAAVVAFLLDERVTWLTGQTIWVNGGDLMP